MKIEIHKDEQPVRIGLGGAMVGKAAGELSAAIDELSGGGCCDITLDFHALANVDSAGLEALLNYHERCMAGGGRCTLTNVSSKIERILRITRLDRHLEVVAV